MTSIRVQLPEKFHLGRQEEWPKRSRRFERFRQASSTYIHIHTRSTMFYQLKI